MQECFLFFSANHSFWNEWFLSSLADFISQQKYIGNLAAASETAETLLESLQKGKKEGGGGSDQFFQTSAVNFLAACIYFFVNYKKVPYDKDGHALVAEMTTEPKTYRPKPTGRVFDQTGKEVEPEYWLGKYSDMPHILSFLNQDYQTIFEVLETDPEVAPLLGPFQTAMKNKAMEQLEGMIGTLRVYTSRLATKESYWIFHKDGDDFDLKVSDPKNPSYLLIANDPEMESIIGIERNPFIDSPAINPQPLSFLNCSSFSV